MKRQKNMPLLKEGLSASNYNPRGPIGMKRGNRIKKERGMVPWAGDKTSGYGGHKNPDPQDTLKHAC